MAAPAADIGLSRPTAAVGDSIVVATWTMVSRVTGFVRVAAIAAVLGPTYLGNAYQLTNNLPNMLYYGLLGGVFASSLLVPALVGPIDSGDRRSCERIAGGVLGLVLAGLVVVIPIALVAAPLLLRWGAVGVASVEVGASQERIARLLLLMLLPQVFLYAVVSCSSAVMHAYRRFALAAAAPAIENVVSIAVLGAVAFWYRDNLSLQNIPTGALLLLGLGTTAAVASHAAIQWYGAWRAGVTLRPSAGWRDGEVRAILRRTGPSVAQATLAALQLLSVLVVANRIAGGVVAYQVAASFFLVPIALTATPVALSLLPRLSRLHSAGEQRLFRDTVVRGLRFAFFLAVPAALTLAILAPVLATAVSFGRMMEERGDLMVASTLLMLAPAIVAESAFLVATYSSYSRGDTRSPLRSMLLKFVVCAAVLALAWTASGPAVVALAGLAVSAAAVTAATHRICGLLRSLPTGEERMLPAAGRIALAAAVMTIPLWIGARLLGAGMSQFGALLGATAVWLVATAAYVGVHALLRAPETAWLFDALARRAGGAQAKTAEQGGT